MFHAMSKSVNAATGIAGLDDILGGGFPRNRIYLIQGDPGVGKTTLGMHFLMSGREAGERSLYIALSESRLEILSVVESHGWSLDGIDMIELSALEQSAGLEAVNTLFEPSEVELHETTRRVLTEVERLKPDRVVFDSLSEMRLLAQGALRYRRQILALKQYFGDKNITVLLLDDRTSDPGDLQLQSLAHGVIAMEQHPPTYGADRRRMRVVKMRGRRFRSGYHDFTIDTGKLVVFPRLIASEHHAKFDREPRSSGVPELDRLLGGGLEPGTATLFLGPAGSGKSTIAIQFALAAAARGEHAAVFAFDERLATLYLRTRAIGGDLETHVASGRLKLQQVDAAEMSAGEFAHVVRGAVEAGCKLIVIDSLNGYLQAMADEQQLTVQLHELLAYLANRGVVTILVMAQHGLTGVVQSTVDVSYIADTVVMLRYFEAQGRIRKAISVLKKRSGAHEDTIRELCMGPGGVDVGPSLGQFTGVLTGAPQFMGGSEELAGRGR